MYYMTYHNIINAWMSRTPGSFSRAVCQRGWCHPWGTSLRSGPSLPAMSRPQPGLQPPPDPPPLPLPLPAGAGIRRWLPGSLWRTPPAGAWAARRTPERPRWQSPEWWRWCRSSPPLSLGSGEELSVGEVALVVDGTAVYCVLFLIILCVLCRMFERKRHIFFK